MKEREIVNEGMHQEAGTHHVFLRMNPLKKERDRQKRNSVPRIEPLNTKTICRISATYNRVRKYFELKLQAAESADAREPKLIQMVRWLKRRYMRTDGQTDTMNFKYFSCFHIWKYAKTHSKITSTL